MDSGNQKWSGYISNNDVTNRVGGNGQLGPAYEIIIKDSHFGNDKTGQATVQQKVYLYYNQPPTITNPVPDQMIPINRFYEYTFASTTFIEPEGEPMSYTSSCSPTCTWLTFDSTNRKYSGTPVVGGVYTISLVASDISPNSADTTDSFVLTVNLNQQPDQDQGLYTVPKDVSVFQQFSYVIPTDAFKDDEDDEIILSFTIDPGSITPDYDPITRKVSWTLQDNTAYGTYTLTVYVNDAAHLANPPYSESVTFEYHENRPPQVLSMPANPNCILANHPLNHWITTDLHFNEPDKDTISYSFISDVAQSWISINNQIGVLNFTGMPTDSDVGNYQITLTLDDGHSQVANATTTFNI